MKLTGNLKKQVEATVTKDEARKVIRKASMILDDAELDQVTGGEGENSDSSLCNCGLQPYIMVGPVKQCLICGKPKEKLSPGTPGYYPNGSTSPGK